MPSRPRAAEAAKQRPRATAHRAVLALSFAPDLAPATRERLSARAGRALALLCDGAAARLVVDETDAAVFEAGAMAPHHVADDGAFVRSFGVGGTDWRAARPCDAPHLLAALRTSGAAGLADYTPPFAALFRTRREGPLEAATDACGIMHVYVTAGAGFAACGSSSVALAALGDAGLDLESLAVMAHVGFYIGARTPFAGVRRLRPGESCALVAGAVRIAVWNAPIRPEPAYADFAQAVDAGADALRAAVGSAVAAHPRLGISLSGGLDSRLVLAAIPASCRSALAVSCIEVAGVEDAPLVRRLAALCGFAPTMVNVGDFPRPLATAFAEASSRRRNYGPSPLATGVLEWAESLLPSGPRLHGQNGELLRGFYYTRRHLDEPVSDETVATLLASAHFRRATPALLASAYRAPIVAMLQGEIHGMLSATGLPWCQALDEFYLAHHMAGWVGTELSRTSMYRVDLSPFFDPRFLAFARRAAPRDKFESRLGAAVVEALDPALAAVPLDGLPPPAELWRAETVPPRRWPTPSSQPGAPVGAEAVRTEMLTDLAAGRLSLGRAAELPLFDADGLAAALAADAPVDVKSFGFALNVEWMLAFLEQVRA